MARISLHNVQKRFGDVVAIPDLNLEIHDKEFVALVGPSGCGKTTTLRMVAGLEPVTDGEIHIGDREVTQLRPGLRNISMVFQNYALYPHMTVRDNITYGMRVRGADKADIDRRLAEAARILGLEPYLDRRPKHLSGGQRQRVAIGRAIMRDPDVFLFDEPLSNLDAKLRIEMRTEIKTLHRRLQNTVIYVTHDQVEAMTMADRVVVMRNGFIEQVAPPIELYERPSSKFVASFIGSPSMNFLEVQLISADGIPTLLLDDGTQLQLPAHLREACARQQGTKITLGIRPEHTTSHDRRDIAAPTEAQQAGQGAGHLTLRVMAIEPLGAHTLLIGDVAGTRFTAQVDAHFKAQVGETVAIGYMPGNMHLFDPVSESVIRPPAA
ncbi:MAG TPA: sn-glycerol-3-phosphate ABC transporter ATP-binding protein UgpC [Dongiaceae bacterium]|nr:sn-glycerol-3-phosphate ABC transporter ATP-binding protein UgpC [Dongiaceae bacterium]